MSISKAFLIFGLAASVSCAVVSGQTVQKKKTTPRSPSSTVKKPRVQRTTPATQEPAKQATDPTPSSSTETAAQPVVSPAAQNGQESVATKEAKPVETPASTPATETVVTPPDPIQTLRDEIDAAATPQDRNRLKLKLADMLVSSGRKADGINELHGISASDDFDPQGLYNAGNALVRLGDTSEAISAYRKAVEQRKGRYSRALNNLGVVLLRAGRWDESQDALLAALKVEGFRYAEASYNLGRLYAARGESDLAVREWRRALLVDPQHKAAAQSLARMSEEDRITVEATPRPVTARENSARTSHVDVKPVTKAADRPAALTSSSSRVLSLDPVSFNYLQKARSASEQGNTSEAIRNYQQVILRQRGYFAPANLELSYLLIGLKRNAEAMGVLLDVANRDGGRYPVSYYHLGRLYEINGDLKSAEQAFAKTVAAYKTNSQFFLDLSRVREKLGDFRGALDAMEQFLIIVKKDGQDLAWPEERIAELRKKAESKPQ